MRNDRRAGGAIQPVRRSEEHTVLTVLVLFAFILVTHRVLAVPGRAFRFRVVLLPVPSIEVSGSSCGHHGRQLAGSCVGAGEHDGDALTGHGADGGETGGACRFEEEAEVA